LKVGRCVALGFLWGLGIAAKWTLLLAAIPISGAFLLSLLTALKRRMGRYFFVANLKRAALTVVMALAGFLAGMPDVWRRPDKVYEGLTFEIKHHQQGHWGEVTVDEHGFAHRTGRSLKMMADGGSIYLGVAGLVAVLFSLARLTRPKAYLLWTLLLWLFLVVNRNVIAFERHYLVPFIIMVLILAATLVLLVENRRGWVRLTASLVGVFLVFSSLLYTCICISPFWQEEARLACSKWIKANLPAGSGVAAAPHTPMWLNPGAMVDGDLALQFPQQARPGMDQYIIACGRSLKKFTKHPPCRPIVPSEWFPQQPPSRQDLLLYAEMNNGGGRFLSLVKEFRARPSFLGLDLRWFGREPDQDTTFANQAVSLFRLNTAKERAAW